MKKVITIALAAICIGLPLTSQAMPMLDFESNDRLIAATNVKVGMRTFNAEFIDGNCIGLLNGSDSPNDFAFNSLPSAQQALQSVLDTVIRLSSAELFPNQVRGCDDPFACRIITPFGFPAITDSNAPLAVLSAGLFNAIPVLPASLAFLGSDRVLTTPGFSFRADTTEGRSTPGLVTTTFARFSEVPEPSSLALFTLAFIGLELTRRRAKKTTHG